MQDTHIPAIVMKCLIMMIRLAPQIWPLKHRFDDSLTPIPRSINCVKASLLNDIPADVIAYVTLGQLWHAPPK